MPHIALDLGTCPACSRCPRSVLQQPNIWPPRSACENAIHLRCLRGERSGGPVERRGDSAPGWGILTGHPGLQKRKIRERKEKEKQATGRREGSPLWCQAQLESLHTTHHLSEGERRFKLRVSALQAAAQKQREAETLLEETGCTPGALFTLSLPSCRSGRGHAFGSGGTTSHVSRRPGIPGLLPPGPLGWA